MGRDPGNAAVDRIPHRVMSFYTIFWCLSVLRWPATFEIEIAEGLIFPFPNLVATLK